MFRYLCRKIRLNIYILQCDFFKCALINKLYEMVMLTALLIVLFMKEDLMDPFERCHFSGVSYSRRMKETL